MNTLSRQQENAARTRQALLNAARQLFISRGYHTVSIDEIAHDARVTKGAFYHHFKCKSDLLLHCYDAQLALISQCFDNREPQGDHWQTLEHIVCRYVDFLLANYQDLIPVQEIMPVIGWDEFERINALYITDRVRAMLCELRADQAVKNYDIGLMSSLIEGFMMHMAINIIGLRDVEGLRDDFLSMYYHFLQTLKA